MADGTLPTVKAGRRLRVPASAVERLTEPEFSARQDRDLPVADIVLETQRLGARVFLSDHGVLVVEGDLSRPMRDTIEVLQPRICEYLRGKG